jgi:RHH-type proline utilization regulon transcriptional repressor/proline dehydrogenase/delta 1-pyrroline-5-carboxylate dehydrogenase
VGAGRYFAPLAVEVGSLAAVEREVFGPVLHIVRYRADGPRPRWSMSINRMGYGLTLGIHTRIDSAAQAIAERVQVGNVYVNRNMIGAVVGVQPFGGCGLSGTGPKAGGPHYLQRFRDRTDGNDQHRRARRQRQFAVAVACKVRAIIARQ